MQLQSLTLANFRGFTHLQTIHMDGDIVVLWGPNGTGKTSLLDGLHWVLVGHVPRLEASSLKADEEAIESRYRTGAPFASLVFEHAGRRWRVNRTGMPSSKSRVTVEVDDGTILEHDAAESFLRPFVGDGDNTLRSVVLQQDDLTALLSGDTRERYRFLAELTGLEGLRVLGELVRSELRALRSATKERVAEADAARVRVKAGQEELDQTRALLQRQDSAAKVRVHEATSHVAAWFVTSETKIGDELREADRVLAETKRLVSVGEDARRHLREEPERSTEPTANDERLLAEISEIDTKLARYQDESDAIGVRVVELQAAQADAAKQRGRVQQLAALALDQVDGERCPVCGQGHVRANTMARLRAMLDVSASPQLSHNLSALDHELAMSRREITVLEAQRRRLVQEVARRREGGEAESHSRAIVDETVAALTRLCGPLSDTADPFAAARSRVADLEKRVANLESARGDLNNLEALANRAHALEQDVAARRARLVEVDAAANRLLAREDRSRQVGKWVGQQAEEIGEELMQRAAPLADALFRRFNVHPTFRRFAFKPDRIRAVAHLRPWVYDDERELEGNAVQLLSAAQLNALAISLFLALNLEDESPLQLAVLDDPVQNMDDLNVLSLIDVLRAIRTRRQVIVTTHDMVLAQLLTTKLRPAAQGQKTLLVKLSQWTTAGPTVTSERRDFIPGRDLQLLQGDHIEHEDPHKAGPPWRGEE